MNHPNVINCNFMSWNSQKTACTQMYWQLKGVCCAKVRGKTLCPYRNKEVHHVNETVREDKDATVQDSVV